MAKVTLEFVHEVDIFALTRSISRLDEDDLAAFARDFAYDLCMHDEDGAERFARIVSETVKRTVF